MPTETELKSKLAQLKAKREISTSLLQITHDLSTAQDEDVLLEVLIRRAQTKGAYLAQLMYVDSDESGEPEWIDIVAVWHKEDMPQPLLEMDTRFRLSEFPATQFWLKNPHEPQIISDVDTAELDVNSRAILHRIGCRAAVVIPLSRAGRWLGVVTLHWAEPREFSEEEIAIYRALPGLASPAVENHRLMKTLQQTISERDEQRQFLRAVLDASPDTIYFKDKNSVYRLCNEAFARHHGRKLSEILNHSVFDLFSQEIAQRYRDEDIKVMKGGKQVVLDREFEKGAGIAFYESIKKPMYATGGEVIGLIAFDRDITERKRSEAALLAERNLLRTLIDALPDHIYAKDLEGRIVFANSVQARSLGFEDSEEPVGKTDFDFYDEQVARQVREADQVVFQSGEPVSLEEFFVDSEGNKRWYWSVKLPMEGTNGEMIGLVGMSREITEQKLLEEKAVQEREQRAVIEAQKQVIQELSTPIIPVMDQVIIMPLIGNIDSLRSREITRALLSGISQFKARVVIMDVTGVPLVDSGVAAHLNKTIQAARLKGAHTIVTGLSDAVAETIVDLGLDWTHIETLDNMQTGLLFALSRLGVKLVHVRNGNELSHQNSHRG